MNGKWKRLVKVNDPMMPIAWNILGYEDMEARKVQRMGYIKYDKERYQLSTALRG